MQQENLAQESITKYPIIQVEEPEYCKLKVHYEADPEVIETKLDEAIASVRHVNIPGFRKGKVSDQVIRLKLKNHLDQYVAREMANHAVNDIIFETNSKIIGTPKIDNLKINAASAGKKMQFQCDIEINKRPSFTLAEYKGIEVASPHIQDDADVMAEKSLLNIRKSMGETQPYSDEDVVEFEDNVTLTITYKIPDQDEVKIEGELYKIGQNRWKDFDNYLIGMKSNETRNFQFVFEEGELTGKTAQFSVTIHMGTKSKIHPIDDEFLKKLECENVNELMTKVKAAASFSINKKKMDEIRNQVAMKLVEAHYSLEIPKFLADSEVQSILNNSGQDLKSLSEENLNNIKEYAVRNIKLSFILDSIREVEPDTVLSEEEAKNALVQHFQTQGQDPAVIFNNSKAQGYIHHLLNQVKNEFTLQWISNQAIVKE